MDEERFSVSLTDDERAMLRWGLLDWGGPASCNDELARVMGFRSTAHLFEEGGRLAHMVEAGDGLTKRDWTRALVATEFVWASDVFGSGRDAVVSFGHPDSESVEILRSLQWKLLEAEVVVPGDALS